MLETTLKLTELSAKQLGELQSKLKAIGLYHLAVDGIYGTGTQAAWKQFKAENYLSDPDLIGPTSYQLLETLAIAPKEILSRATFNQIFAGATNSDRNKYFQPINQALQEFEINNPRRIAAFAAQIIQESGNLRYNEEIASGAAYEGRQDLGNVQPGDGRRFKGRGLIQITGRHNYGHYGRLLGLPLLVNQTLAEEPVNSARIAGLYWKDRGLNPLADKNTLQSFREITRRINGGFNHLNERIKYWEHAKAVLGVN